jgi:glycosyltransferase involved in cell wall biosynthesis
VHFAGKVSNQQLKTYYAYAGTFLCASEHEGFCVPLVEAMYYGVPIVAYGGSAVGETVGDAAVVWGRPAPGLMAQSIRLLEDRPDWRHTIIAQQRARYESHFTTAALERQLEQALTPLLSEVCLS